MPGTWPGIFYYQSRFDQLAICWHARQIFSGVAGMSIVRAGFARDRVGDRVHHRGDRGGGAGFARALDAERVGGRRHEWKPSRNNGRSCARGIA